ncbi:hypothetical protein KB221_08220 [Aquidulcibacter paucihalophilus]|nr:hypothetical protein KB221_08220 [Aquidulcibacter paucihalophilus]
MSSYDTSREPMLMREFLALAESQGWSRAARDPEQPRDEMNLVDGAGRMIVAYPQPTRFGEHTGFKGGCYGLVQVWNCGSPEQAALEGHDQGDDLDEADTTAALARALAYYGQKPAVADYLQACPPPDHSGPTAACTPDGE